jgi:hypothetical protein
MPDDNDPDYYAARERHARELAASALEPNVKAIHLEMAERYARLRFDIDSARQAGLLEDKG